MLAAKEEVIIESPYLTTKRLKTLIPIFQKLKDKNIKIYIITRYPQEHDNYMAVQSEMCIRYFENAGIQVLLEDGGHHRKLAMIDRKITFEGSLNILSQSQSREFMRRIDSHKLTVELFHFLQFDNLTIFNNNSR